MNDEEYDEGRIGFICERWLASATRADNNIGPEDEGLSYIEIHSDEEITLKRFVESAPDMIMGREYSKKHRRLGRCL